MLATQFHTK